MSQFVEPTCFEGVHCTVTVEPCASDVLVVRFSGHDVGEFGEAPMRCLEERLPEGRAARLFIDARAVKGASVDVSGDWARWLGEHRGRLAQINMLTGSPFIQLTAEFVRKFAELGDIMRIYTEPARFDEALEVSRHFDV